MSLILPLLVMRGISWNCISFLRGPGWVRGGETRKERKQLSLPLPLEVKQDCSSAAGLSWAAGRAWQMLLALENEIEAHSVVPDHSPRRKILPLMKTKSHLGGFTRMWLKQKCSVFFQIVSRLYIIFMTVLLSGLLDPKHHHCHCCSLKTNQRCTVICKQLLNSQMLFSCLIPSLQPEGHKVWSIFKH